MTAAPTFVVMGASGRVGRHLLPLLREGGHRVISVSRRSALTGAPEHDQVQVDLTKVGEWPHALETVARLLHGTPSVVLVDLVLDRANVSAMRRSIAGVTAFTLRSSRRLAADGMSVRVLSASTVAALALPAFQTPYGRAKRRQALLYSRLPAAELVLLPQLAVIGEAGERVAPEVNGIVRISYAEAAGLLFRVGNGPATHALWALSIGTPPSRTRPRPSDVTGAVTAVLTARTTRREDPAAHRRASRACLALMPRPVRARVDHHQVPARLLHSFSERLKMPWVTDAPGAGMSARREDGHAQS